MPELPEVEVVKKSLQKEISNLTIKDVKIKDSNLRYKVKRQDLNKIVGLKILKIKRRSKYLLFFFEMNILMLFHLGMTGKFFVVDKDRIKQRTSFYYKVEDSSEKHNRLIFTFTNNLQLIYHDVRKFGFVKIDLANNIDKNIHLKFLGPEPFDNFFNFRYFKNYLIGKNRSIKELLLDQKFVSGLGNIYVNEILFLSKIRPNRKSLNLSDLEIRKVLKNTKKVLKKAIAFGGSSIKNFSNSTGKKGNFQQYFKVYSNKGGNCSYKHCKGIIKKIVISNRASFYCSKCQK